MSARIYSADEARALRAAAAPAPWETAFGRTYGENPRYEYFVRMVGGDFAVAADVCGEDEMPSKPTADLIAAAHDLAASVEHHAARADAAEQECARLRARVAELESLATGPRGLVVDDAACAAIDGAASIGPQGVDATGREVLPF